MTPHRCAFVPFFLRKRRVQDQLVMKHEHGEMCLECGARRNVIELPVGFDCGHELCPIRQPLPAPGIAA